MQKDVEAATLRLQAELKAKVKGDYRLIVQDPTPTSWDPLSLAWGGREAHLLIEGDGTAEHRLALLWGLAIPLGWTPWDRWPLTSGTSKVYHYFGPWATVVDHLAGSGRGEAVWPSVCAAAQCEAGRWEGDHGHERWIQAMLHRLGYNPGPIDGVVGPETQGILRSMGLGQMSLKDAMAALMRKQVPDPDAEPKASTNLQGKVVLGSVKHSIHTFGAVSARRDGRLTIRGHGRIVIDLWP